MGAESGRNAAAVRDLIEVMENFAPPALAEAWDNCGLQTGDPDWPVKKVWIALDPLLEVVEAANRQQVDLLITHHPLLITPLTHIDLQTTLGKTIAASLRGMTAIYSAHTNLDSTRGGVNDTLAQRLGLINLTALVPAADEAQPRQAHGPQGPCGLGRTGDLGAACTIGQLAADIKRKLGIDGIRVVGDTDRMVHRVAVCSGSGGGLLPAFFSSGAEVFISGDLKYHDARSIEDAGCAVIDIGHFASEHLIIDPLADWLDKETRAAGWELTVEACRLERDPFSFV